MQASLLPAPLQRRNGSTGNWASHPVIVLFIAETGGQNALIADSSAHKEQLVQDAVLSAFNSAGQRCSALRVLFVPHAIADQIKTLLIGAMQQLRLGSPADYAVDIGPVISASAVAQLKTMSTICAP